VYVGTLLERDGVGLAIEALPKIAAHVPQVTLTIIGYGAPERALRVRAKQLGVEDRVDFLGAIADADRVEDIVSRCAVGLAPYSDEGGTVKRFNDPSKPKLYLTCGVPQIITRVPLIANDLEQRGAAIAIDHDPSQLANMAIRILSDRNLLNHYRAAAIDAAYAYNWVNIFDQMFASMLSV
jgi:glycosyltransferase involved in cell wall biosynthesis